MDFTKLMIMFIFMNVIITSSVSVIDNQMTLSLENNGLNNLVFDGSKDIEVVSTDSGLISTLYEATIGNAIDWGSGILSYFGLAEQDDASIKSYYDLKKEVYPISAMIMTIIIVFQWTVNVYVGIATYRFIKNKNG